MRCCAVADNHVRAGPHHSCRLVARVERREPKGLCFIPPHGVTVVSDVEVFVTDRVVHVAGQDAMRFCIQPSYLQRKTTAILVCDAI